MIQIGITEIIINGNKPRHGLSVARMIAHITYLSEGAFQKIWQRYAK